MFVSGHCGEIIDLNRGSSLDASCQVSVPLARQFQRRFIEIDESETRIACGGDVLNGSGHHVDASHQLSVHLTKRFQRRRLLEIDQSEAIIACGGHAC